MLPDPHPPRSGDNVSDVVAWMAYAAPERVALEVHGEKVTYAELEVDANRLAHRLLEIERGRAERPGPRPQAEDESRVLLWLHGFRATVTASLAVLRAGMVSVPVDPTSPPDRVGRVAGRVGALLTLTDIDPEAPELIASTPCSPAVLEPLEASKEGRSDSTNLRPPARLAAIVFTSGTTGEPKGIMVPAEQRPTVDDATIGAVRDRPEGRDLEQERREANEREPMRIGYLWGGTVGNVEGNLQRLMLLAGTLVVFDLRREGVARLGRWLKRERVFGCFTLFPTVLRQLLATLEPGEIFDEVQMVALTGEAVRWEDVRRLRAHLPSHAILVSAYGMTEAGLIASQMIVSDTELGEGSLPVGVPGGGREVAVVDEKGDELPAGEVGEIQVTATDIALGYWDEPELTQRAFQELPDGRRRLRTGDRGRWLPDGQLEVLGRLDHMVKVAGNRVELGDIESALRLCGGVAEAAATTYLDRTGALRLAAFAAPAAGQELDVGAVRRELAERLPGVMLPDRIGILDEIPQLATGKIDRRSLPSPEEAAPRRLAGRDAPTSALEEELAAIWAQVLELHQVGAGEDFFELGGDSLRAARVFAEIEDRLGFDRPISLLLGARTVRQLAAVLEREPRLELIPFQPLGSRPPLFLIHDHFGNLFPMRDMSAMLGPDQPVYGVPAAVLNDPAEPPATLHGLADLYTQAIRQLVPSGPYLFYGHGMGGLVAFEMALGLQEEGEEVSMLAVSFVVAPGLQRPWPQRVRNALGRRRRALATRMGGGEGELDLELDPDHGLSAVQRSEAAASYHRSIIRGYRPRRRLAGDLVLVLTHGLYNSAEGWARWVEGEVRTVPMVGLGSAARQASTPANQAIRLPA